MAVKTLTIKERVYAKLKEDKRPDESFSDYFERLIKNKKPNYFKIVGIWSEKKAEAIRSSIKKARKEDEALSKEREKRIGLL